MKRLCTSVLVAAIVLLTMVVSPSPDPARGFTPDESLTNNSPNDQSDDLHGVSRWSYTPGSLVLDGVRGLGGGLEYSVAADFCERLIPQFVDEPKPTCDQLKQAIRRSFDKWSAGHPVIRFVDVSDRVRAELPPPGEAPWRGFGAEIDFFALSGEQYPPVQPFAAYTTTWYIFADPVGTNGRVVQGSTITSVDVVLKATTCFFLAPRASSPCNHFESLVLHEIGHALSLDHPNEFPSRNFDANDDPYDATAIDCDDPALGLKLSRNFDPQAVMNSSLGQPLQVRLELTNDDLAGRDFFYPICPQPRSGVAGSGAARRPERSTLTAGNRKRPETPGGRPADARIA